MLIQEVYDRYQIPPNLQLHMRRVAAVGLTICEQFLSPEQVNPERIVKTLLLHDLGNIIKFDFTDPSLLGEEARRLEHWQKVRKDYITRYGHEHQATISIAQELGISSDVLALLERMGSAHLIDALRSDDWNQKIACYSDFRVGPFGFLTVNERFDDLQKRYSGRHHDLGHHDKVEQRRLHCLRVEQQLSAQMVQPADKLTDQDFAMNLNRVLNPVI